MDFPAASEMPPQRSCSASVFREVTLSKKITIASASSAEYFHFLQGMVLSVRDKPQSQDIDICLYDLGLTDEQLAWLSGHVNTIVKPKWEYGLSEKSGMRDPFRAILAKPLLP